MPNELTRKGQTFGLLNGSVVGPLARNGYLVLREKRKNVADELPCLMSGQSAGIVAFAHTLNHCDRCSRDKALSTSVGMYDPQLWQALK